MAFQEDAFQNDAFQLETGPPRGVITWAEFEVPAFAVAVSGSHTYPSYRLELHEINGDVVLESVPIIAGTLEHGETLNEPSQIAWESPVYEISAGDLSVGTREAWLYRDEELIAAGDLVNASYTSRGGVRFFCKGFARRLYRRLISETLTYLTTDLIEMMWAIIDWTNGIEDTGITRDPTSTALGVIRSQAFPWWEFTNIGEIADRMVERPKGFDAEVTPLKAWKAYHHRRGVTLDPDVYSFEQGKNIEDPFGIEHDAEQTTTKLWVRGFGTGKDTHVASSTDEDGIAQYGLLEDVYDRTERGWVPYLGGVAKRKLDTIYRDVRVTPSFSAQTEDPPFGTYSVGDQVTVRYDKGWLQLDAPFRIMSRKTKVGKDRAEFTDLVFAAKLIDVPEVDPDEEEES